MTPAHALYEMPMEGIRGFSGDTKFAWPLVRSAELVKLNYGKALVEAERQYGIFFLQRQPGGFYTVTDPFHPALVASPLRVPNQQKSPDVLAGLVGELIGVLRAPAATLTDPVNGVGNLMTAAPADQAQQVYFEAATALQTVPYAVAGPALGAIAASSQVPARLWAIYSLFSMVVRFSDAKT